MTTLTELVTTCLEEVERKYGTGGNDGEFPKAYHNRKHTEDVIADTIKIAEISLERHKISPRQKELLYIAAAFHNIEQNSPGYGNELASADMMDEMVSPSKLFTADELLEIREIILGTEISKTHGIPMQIYAQGHLAQILADADLAALGKSREVYLQTFEAQFTELYPEQLHHDRITFLNESLLLLKNHHFFTAEAEYLYQEQGENLVYIKEELEKLAPNI